MCLCVRVPSLSAVYPDTLYFLFLILTQKEREKKKEEKKREKDTDKGNKPAVFEKVINLITDQIDWSQYLFNESCVFESF